jgi:hypothetical protein
VSFDARNPPEVSISQRSEEPTHCNLVHNSISNLLGIALSSNASPGLLAEWFIF